MKTLFIPAKSKVKINKSKIAELSKKLPKEIAIAYSIQFQDVAKEVKQILSKTHNITSLIQVLGCSKPNFQKNTKAILLIGNGKFHAVSIAYESKLPVYLLQQNKLEKISDKEIQKLETSNKTSYLKFLHADRVGIIISTKPGQQNLKKAIELKQRLSCSGYPKTQNSGAKKSYLFISNNINTAEFENFQINSWVNTACPRMDMNDSSIINVNKLKF